MQTVANPNFTAHLARLDAYQNAALQLALISIAWLAKMTIESDRARRPQWETFPHGADVGVRGFGANPGQAFANAALAMMSIVTDPGAVSSRIRVPIACSAPDMETLLYDWLNALVLEMAADDLIFSRFDIEINGMRLKAVAWGERIDRERHQPVVEIKGATYTTAQVAQDPDGQWRAQCVVDV